MPSTIGNICARLIAHSDAWLISRRHDKVVRLVERLILAYELETDIYPIAKKLLRCNQQDVSLVLGMRLMRHGKTYTVSHKQVDEDGAIIQFDLSALVRLRHAQDAAIAAAQYASVHGAAVAYDEIRLRALGIKLL